MSVPDRFPKVASPYERAENSDGDYVVDPSSSGSTASRGSSNRDEVVDPDGDFLGVKDEYAWVFDRADEVQAVEKLDGTNVAVVIENGRNDFEFESIHEAEGVRITGLDAVEGTPAIELKVD